MFFFLKKYQLLKVVFFSLSDSEKEKQLIVTRVHSVIVGRISHDKRKFQIPIIKNLHPAVRDFYHLLLLLPLPILILYLLHFPH